jgi:hypothetical protein
MICWICRANADSHDHRIKASDLRSIFGHVSQQDPLFLHTDLRRNRLVKGLKADTLKSRARICRPCNNQRTQAHDFSWEKLSNYLRSQGRNLKTNERIGLHKVFPGKVKEAMLNVHLYFVKVFGCQMVEHQVPIDIAPFSQAILQGTAHPNIHLAFCSPFDGTPKTAGYTDIHVIKKNGSVVFAVWLYYLDRFSIRIMYAEPGERRAGLVNSWHPSSIKKYIRISHE